MTRAREVELLRWMGHVCTFDSTFVHPEAGVWLPEHSTWMGTFG